MIRGINHITLSVRSLIQSFEFYESVLGFKPIMRNSKSAYFLAGDLWFCIEQDENVRELELPEYSHIAFAADQNDFAEICARIIKSGAKIFKENVSEGDSIYFVDPNGHKLEVHVGDLQARLAKYRNKAGTEFFD
jgi:catechol 2,3-dioxygenase-like lactoylglutathione lyase family enzyme